jgi:pancreatic triacylglycerol lipase
MEPLGHLDFYPNGGMRQPGCNPSNWPSILADPTAILSDVIACDHTRAIYLFIDSLIPVINCKTIGYKCTDYDSFNKVTATTCFKYNQLNSLILSSYKRANATLVARTARNAHRLA